MDQSPSTQPIGSTVHAHDFTLHDPDQQSVDELEQGLLALHANLSAATYRFLTLLRSFDLRGGWHGLGVRSMAHWLGWRCGIAIGSAREQLRVAHALANLPQVAAAFAAGRISYSKTRAITRVATAETEGCLLDIALCGTAAHLERVVAHARQSMAFDDPDRLRRMVNQARCDWYFDDDGMLVLRARLLPDDGARLVQALRAMETKVSDAGQVAELSTHYDDQHVEPASARRARALAAVAEAAVATEPKGSVPEIVVHIRAENVPAETRVGQAREEADTAATASIDGYTAISTATAHRLCCDASVVAMRENAAGEPLSIGRRSRTIPTAIWRALQARDQHCRFPGCDHRRFVHGHHIQHWAHGGATSLDNLVTVCSYHHQLLHEGGYSVQRSGANRFCFFTPRGKPISEAAPQFTGEPAALVEHNQRCGIHISAETGDCGWDGTPFNYDHTLFVLLQPASAVG